MLKVLQQNVHLEVMMMLKMDIDNASRFQEYGQPCSILIC